MGAKLSDEPINHNSVISPEASELTVDHGGTNRRSVAEYLLGNEAHGETFGITHQNKPIPR